ncbi:hypothetical protein NM688_g7986 [Phlebia brevispora]|uniref:Uncharacterized protein n=1 Tax=Phlebia brevispora TaxID=194682 RepID=A0ACC1RYX0_9APHY|nr:hypothetical protein NM688_g7986 [Phlebia brevispora]
MLESSPGSSMPGSRMLSARNSQMCRPVTSLLDSLGPDVNLIFNPQPKRHPAHALGTALGSQRSGPEDAPIAWESDLLDFQPYVHPLILDETFAHGTSGFLILSPCVASGSCVLFSSTTSGEKYVASVIGYSQAPHTLYYRE